MTTDESDAEDDRLLAAGDLAALFARHLDDLRTHARVRVGADRADDVVQSAILRTLRELAAGRRYPIPFRAVLHQHVRWSCLDALGETNPGALPEGWDLVDPLAEEAYVDLVDRLALQELFDRLPPGDARVMSLLYFEGRTPTQIAEDLGMTRNAVDQALWRGRAALRREWPGG